MIKLLLKKIINCSLFEFFKGPTTTLYCSITIILL